MQKPVIILPKRSINHKTKNINPMKRFASLYSENPIVALIVKSVALFLYATTIVFIITLLAVAFTG
jgi:hypothetical protein